MLGASFVIVSRLGWQSFGQVSWGLKERNSRRGAAGTLPGAVISFYGRSLLNLCSSEFMITTIYRQEIFLKTLG